MQTTRSIDGDLSWQLITSLLSGFLEHTTKQLIAFHALVELPHNTQIPINMLSVMNTDGPAFNTRSKTCQHLSPDTSTPQPDITPEVSEVTDPTPKSLTADRLEALL